MTHSMHTACIESWAVSLCLIELTGFACLLAEFLLMHRFCSQQAETVGYRTQKGVKSTTELLYQYIDSGFELKCTTFCIAIRNNIAESSCHDLAI